jgi:hypothetical protein
VKPDGIRPDKMVSDPALGVRGDPSKSTPEIGRMILEFKANAGILQFRALKAAANRPTEARRPQGQTVLENAYVTVTQDGVPCASPSARCRDRVIVAMSDLQFRAGGAQRAMTRGKVAAFKAGESYEAPTGGSYYEVAFKPDHPPVQSPPLEMLLPLETNVTLYDGDWFFAFEEKLPLGGDRGRHGHSQRVVIQMNATRLKQKPDGQPEIIRDIVPNRPSFNEAVVHTTTNVGDQPLHGIVIEFKPQGGRPTSR